MSMLTSYFIVLPYGSDDAMHADSPVLAVELDVEEMTNEKWFDDWWREFIIADMLFWNLFSMNFHVYVDPEIRNMKHEGACIVGVE
jgi:hypothetical protein